MPQTVTIAIDATQAAYPNPTGIGVYSQKLIAALAALPQFQHGDTRLLLCFRPGPYWRWARKQYWPDARISPLFEFWPRPGAAALFHGLNQRLTAVDYPARVVTIHDLFPLTSREYSRPDFQLHFSEILQRTVARAHRVIAVSEFTRQQLIQYTVTPAEKITVVHHGVDAQSVPAQAERDAFRERVLELKPGEKYFLSVGAIQVRKNISNIVLALAQLPHCNLVLAGGEGYGAEEIISQIDKQGLSNRVIRLGHATTGQLRLLYATACALVFPSFEEGFGMPILEAMSYGLPVITSNCSSMPEVAGDAALLVDPNNILQIAEAMRRLAEDDVAAAALAHRGQERVKLFSWEKCANETWRVYEEALRDTN